MRIQSSGIIEAANDDWLDHAASFPVAFAQVREDALTDHWIASQLPEGACGLMIASGGCTAALLAAGGRFERLTLVDANPAQLALAQLKLAMVERCATPERLGLLGHVPMPAGARGRRLLELLDLCGLSGGSLGPGDTLAEAGPDHIGRYEWLFARLRRVLGDSATTEALLRLDDAQAQAAFLRAHPGYIARLERAFDEVMALPNLVALFGASATQNAVQPFARHFFQRTMHALETLPAATNPYLAQLLLGRFEATVYPWLNLAQQPIATQVDYARGAMAEVLTDTGEHFDFIHLSNILDWLSEKEAVALLDAVSARLTPGGWVIIRQLNSALNIPALGAGLDWQVEVAAQLHACDRSFFYQSLHIGRKCG